MGNKPLAYSRWRRLPAGVHRITEHRLPDYRSEPQRLTLFVPGWMLDEAERLGIQEGFSSVQEYCEAVLQGAIEAKTQRPGVPKGEPRFTETLDLDEIAGGLHAVAGWPASAGLPQIGEGEAHVEPLGLAMPVRREPRFSGSEGGDTMEEGASADPREAVAVVLRHAGFLDETGTGLLPSLRRGEPVAPSQAEELLRALVELEQGLRDQERIGRKVAYALYRLAFESQVLLTDAWPGLASDQATLDVLRMVQESVERVLSGEDIRYYVPEAPGEESGA